MYSIHLSSCANELKAQSEILSDFNYTKSLLFRASQCLEMDLPSLVVSQIPRNTKLSPWFNISLSFITIFDGKLLRGTVVCKRNVLVATGCSLSCPKLPGELKINLVFQTYTKINEANLIKVLSAQ